MALNHIFFLLLAAFLSSLAEKPSVIIVGAGPAGIAAATTLLENGITNITILEAESRIGGRIHSVKFDDDYVDLGGQFVHGQEGNIVYELVKDLDLLEHSKPFNSTYFKIYSSDGVVADDDITADLIEMFVNYEEHVTVQSLNDSLKDALVDAYNRTVVEKYKEDKNKSKLAVNGYESVGKLIVLNEASYNWKTVSAKNHGEDCGGDLAMTWKTRGYHRILEVLMKSYPDPSQKLQIDDKIFLKTKVEKIVWNSNLPSVKTSDNSSLTADYVIITPSVGVLKRDKNTLFEPQLPPEKHLALDAIGFEGVGKVFLHFPEKWFNDETSVFFFFWNMEDISKIKEEFPDGPSKDDIPWVYSVGALAAVANHPNVLLAWLGGELLPDIENLDDDVVQRGVMYVIRKFLGKNYNVSEPDQILRSRWVTNPNFLGTWSSDKAGYYKEDVSYQQILSEPLTHNQKPVVLFAGEATERKYYGNVHGAIETGRREAQRIIKLTNKR